MATTTSNETGQGTPGGSGTTLPGAPQADVYLDKLMSAVHKGPCTASDSGVSQSEMGLCYPVSPLTQKAKGMVTLATLSPSFQYKMPRTAIITHQELISKAYDQMGKGTVFARPCPITPMHGFVDSKPCSSLQDLQAMWQAARAADPKAEMMLCRLIHAHWNAILTPNMLIIGPGHDGATSGALTMTIPLTGSLTDRWQQWSAQAGVAVGDVPYLELVADKRWWLTQLRGGPAVSFQVDYVPHEMVVEHVVEAEGDLLEWAEKVAAFKPGTAVWHPNGSLGTHYGVHCVLHKVPIFTSATPVVGTTLVPLPLPDFNVDAIRTGIVAASLLPLDQLQQLRASAVELVLLSLHHSPALRGDHAFWLGVSCCLMARLGIAAALGEWRHAPKFSGKAAEMDSPFYGWDRSKVYTHTLSDVFTYRKILPNALASFLYGNWGGGFGGKKWGACAQSIVKLDEAMHGVFEGRDDARVTALISALNVAVNQAHNNGWWMNKFISAASFDLAAQGDLATPLHALPAIVEIIRVIYRQHAEVESTLYRWLMAPPLTAVTTNDKAAQALQAPLVSSGVKPKAQSYTPEMLAHLKKLGMPIPPTMMPKAPKLTAVPPPAPLLVETAQFKIGHGPFHTQLVFKGADASVMGAAQGKPYVSFTAAVKDAVAMQQVVTVLQELNATVESLSGSGASYWPIQLIPQQDTIDPAQDMVPYVLQTIVGQPILDGSGKPLIVPVPLALLATTHAAMIAAEQGTPVPVPVADDDDSGDDDEDN